MAMAVERARFGARLRHLMATQQPAMTQNRLAVRILQDLGEQVSVTRIRSNESLISRWLSGATVPTARYRAVLGAIFNVTDVELGFAEADETTSFGLSTIEADDERAALVARYEHGGSIGASDIEQLRVRVDELRTDDRGGAPAFVGGLLGAHLEQLTHFANYSLAPGLRAKVLSILADAAGIRGWQLLNGGDLADADAMFRLGEQAAHEADDVAAYAFLRAEHAYVLADVGLTERALRLVESTTEAAIGHVPTVLAAWLFAASAEMAASAGDGVACLARLDSARELLGGADIVPDVPYVLLNEQHLERWSGSILAKLDDPAAIEQLHRAQHNLDRTFVRARSGLLTDLVGALLAAGDVAEASRLFPDAHGLAHLAGSERQLLRLRGLYAVLYGRGEALAS